MKYVLFGLIVVAIAFVLVQSLLKAAGKDGAYKARQLMTENEAEFFGRLIVALPDHYVFPQVAMSALIEAATKDKKRAHRDRLRIAQQRVDYVVCDRSCKVVAVVELDDKTHSRAKDQVRDARLQQAGIRTVRFQSRSKPNVEAVRAAILPAPAVPEVAKVAA
jgi:very-short-patch-repair endonuclease